VTGCRQSKFQVLAIYKGNTKFREGEEGNANPVSTEPKEKMGLWPLKQVY